MKFEYFMLFLIACVIAYYAKHDFECAKGWIYAFVCQAHIIFLKKQIAKHV